MVESADTTERFLRDFRRTLSDQLAENHCDQISALLKGRQPLVDEVPGLSLGPLGQWFTRNETWAEAARAWVSYLARCSYLLQQGRFVADVLYYYGKGTASRQTRSAPGPITPTPA